MRERDSPHPWAEEMSEVSIAVSSRSSVTFFPPRCNDDSSFFTFCLSRPRTRSDSGRFRDRERAVVGNYP